MRLLLLGILIGLISCNKDNGEPKVQLKVMIGEVVSVLPGTDGVEGFLVQMKSADEVTYNAEVRGNEFKEKFEIGKKVALKGNLLDRNLEVLKIVSTDNVNYNLVGTVEMITANRSGYTAKILGENQEVYYAVFSLTNLEDNYKDYKVSETINVKGDLWLSANKLHVTVRQIK